jgi:arsenite methyltransferase
MFRFDLDTPELAQAYGHASPFLFLSGKRLVHALDLAPGHRVLDVGCGTGLLADYVSRLVGADGLVVGIDPLPIRVAMAQQRGRPNVRFQVGTAFDLSDFEADSFDAAYLHLVFHWLPDKVEPLRQLHRVLKPGASVGLTTSARECENTLATACAMVLSHPPYNAYAAGEARSGHVTSAELAQLLRENGFCLTRLETEPTMAEWPSANEAIAFSETISAGNLFGHLPEALRQPARAELVATLERLRRRDVIRIDGARILAVASTR